MARLYGRISHGLTPWRRRGPRAFALPYRHDYSFWSETWQSTEERVRAIAAALRADGSVIKSGGDWDSWDLQVRGGMLGAARLRVGVEEHGAGRQLVRVRAWPWAPTIALVLGGLVAALAAVSLINETDAVTWALGLAATALGARLIYECGAATATVRAALYRPARDTRTVRVPEPATLGEPEALTLGTELPLET
jgi:hypothetical protein